MSSAHPPPLRIIGLSKLNYKSALHVTNFSSLSEICCKYFFSACHLSFDFTYIVFCCAKKLLFLCQIYPSFIPSAFWGVVRKPFTIPYGRGTGWDVNKKIKLNKIQPLYWRIYQLFCPWFKENFYIHNLNINRLHVLLTKTPEIIFSEA